MTNHTQAIEDEAGEAFGIYFDQAQEGYHRLYDLGVIDGTHAALHESESISVYEMMDEHDRSAYLSHWSIRGDLSGPYHTGYVAAYENAMRSEVIAIFRKEST